MSEPHFDCWAIGEFDPTGRPNDFVERYQRLCNYVTVFLQTEHPRRPKASDESSPVCPYTGKSVVEEHLAWFVQAPPNDSYVDTALIRRCIDFFVERRKESRTEACVLIMFPDTFTSTDLYRIRDVCIPYALSQHCILGAFTPLNRHESLYGKTPTPIGPEGYVILVRSMLITDVEIAEQAPGYPWTKLRFLRHYLEFARRRRVRDSNPYVRYARTLRRRYQRIIAGMAIASTAVCVSVIGILIMLL